MVNMLVDASRKYGMEIRIIIIIIIIIIIME